MGGDGVTPATGVPYPRIRVSGDARDRGRAYGAEARHLIHRSLALYEQLFGHYRGWNWLTATDYAQQFIEPIEAFNSGYLEELAGIADGAAVDLNEVLAINVRTEILYGDPWAAGATGLCLGECSSFAALPPSSRGATLLGQNWDMHLPAGRSVVILEQATQTHTTVSVVEAGLLAKTGLNTAGVAVGTNTLVAGSNAGKPGVPYHVILRALLDCATVDEALEMLRSIPFRSSSANYLVADAGGTALDVETAAGGADQLFLVEPTAGLLLHTNHFISPAFSGVDLIDRISKTSTARLERLGELASRAERVDGEFFLSALKDHTGGLNSICCHPDPEMPEIEHVASLYSIVIDVDGRTIWLVPGQPCVTPVYELQCGLGAVAGASTP